MASLYKSVLVETSAKEIIKKNGPVEISTGEWKHLGDNKKNILLAVNYPGISYLPDNELAFLTSILSACKLDLGDIVIMNIANTPQYDYRDYTNHFKSRVVILFGIEPAGFGLPLDFPEFQIQSFSNSTFLYSPSLDACSNDRLLKSKLWLCLQRIFGI